MFAGPKTPDPSGWSDQMDKTSEFLHKNHFRVDRALVCEHKLTQTPPKYHYDEGEGCLQRYIQIYILLIFSFQFSNSLVYQGVDNLAWTWQACPVHFKDTWLAECFEGDDESVALTCSVGERCEWAQCFMRMCLA